MGKMKKYIIIILSILLLPNCLGNNQSIKSLTKEEVKQSLINVDQGEDYYKKKDYTSALIYFKKAANFNNPKALYYLGLIYNMGYGVPIDYNKALDYYDRSSKLGYVSATKNLGAMYHYGLGVKINFNTACSLYKKAINSCGSAVSFNDIGICYEDGVGGFEKNINKAIEYYKKAADLGSEPNLLHLAAVYHNMKDYEKSFVLFKRVSQTKSDIIRSEGLYFLGWYYYYGEGVKKDYKKAVEYFKQSAKLANSNSYNDLGMMYADGEGVKKDPTKAFFYYSKAAELKNKYGLYNVARCYNFGIGVKKDINKAIRYYNLSGDLGYSHAYYNLSVIYKDGEGSIKKDYDTAFDYLVKAAKMGNEKAKSVLSVIDPGTLKSILK